MRFESLKINGYKNLNIDLKHQTDNRATEQRETSTE